MRMHLLKLSNALLAIIPGFVAQDLVQETTAKVNVISSAYATLLVREPVASMATDETMRFANAALDQHIKTRPQPPLHWSAFFTPGKKNEVMSTSWKSNLGQFFWFDNGQRATLVWHFAQSTDLPTRNSVKNFVESRVRELFKTRPYPSEDLRDWFKQSEASSGTWSGVFYRGIKVIEETQSDGRVLLRVVEKFTWDQHLDIVTDGKFLLIKFELKSPQPNPNRNPRPGSYTPFRFHRSHGL